MKFDALKRFISVDMRMSHVYQPVMLDCLLENHGRASARTIAAAILDHDESQIDYYEQIVKNMPGRVLRKHGVVQKDGTDFVLADMSELTDEEIGELRLLCTEKVREYTQRRGEVIWKHRKVSAGYVPGSLRYEVLKRAKFHCELCGVSADIRALEVDHIVPRNKGGTDDESNLQALCYSCNATKRDRDDTDFRAVNRGFHVKDENCAFCRLDAARIVDESPLCIALRDAYPVAAGHTLVIPRRHTPDFFDLGRPEYYAVQRMLDRQKSELQTNDSAISGFNVGVNIGAAAGQTVMHCHIHLIPRRLGDHQNPRGGVRAVILGKADYSPHGSRPSP